MIPVSWIDEIERIFQPHQEVWASMEPTRELFIRLIREHNELEARVERLENQS